VTECIFDSAALWTAIDALNISLDITAFDCGILPTTLFLPKMLNLPTKEARVLNGRVKLQ